MKKLTNCQNELQKIYLFHIKKEFMVWYSLNDLLKKVTLRQNAYLERNL